MLCALNLLSGRLPCVAAGATLKHPAIGIEWLSGVVRACLLVLACSCPLAPLLACLLNTPAKDLDLQTTDFRGVRSSMLPCHQAEKPVP